MQIGQAAGALAALAVKENKSISEVSVRELSHYGITMDTDRTPTTENSAAVSVRGYSSPIVISFISKDDRDLFVSSISSEWSVCIKQMKNSMTG